VFFFLVFVGRFQRNTDASWPAGQPAGQNKHDDDDDNILMYENI